MIQCWQTLWRRNNKKYSLKLTNELDKGYNTTNLKRYRKFYILIQKGTTLSHQLIWSYCLKKITQDKTICINVKNIKK